MAEVEPSKTRFRRPGGGQLVSSMNAIPWKEVVVDSIEGARVPVPGGDLFAIGYAREHSRSTRIWWDSEGGPRPERDSRLGG